MPAGALSGREGGAERHGVEGLADGVAGGRPLLVRADADIGLGDTAAAGANLEDLAVVARAAYEKWRSLQPDPDDPGDGFEDRYLKLGTTIDNAGRVTGNLTPECTLALQAVLDSLGKKAGPEDERTEAQRYHDALQLACELLLRAQLVPDRAGADTRVDAVIDLARLLGLPGASELQEAWLAALAGEHGYLDGIDAEVAACDAISTPVVTGHPDLAVVDQMIDVIVAYLDAAGQTEDGAAGGAVDPGEGTSSAASGDRALSPEALSPQARQALRTAWLASGGPGPVAATGRPGCRPSPRLRRLPRGSRR